MDKNILGYILLILIIYIIYKRNIGYFKVKKMYKKNFDFTNDSYKYYDFITRNMIIPSSDINNIYLIKKYKKNDNDVLLDYGSGNCYNLLNINKSLKFKKLIGIEIDNFNYKKCKKNINLIKDDKFIILNKNAIDYKVPDMVTHIYLYNPFQKNYNINYRINKEEIDVYKKVIKNIKESIKKKNREIIIIFLNINPDHDKEGEILKLFKKNFKTLEINKYKYNNIF